MPIENKKRVCKACCEDKDIEEFRYDEKAKWRDITCKKCRIAKAKPRAKVLREQRQKRELKQKISQKHKFTQREKHVARLGFLAGEDQLKNTLKVLKDNNLHFREEIKSLYEYILSTDPHPHSSTGQLNRLNNCLIAANRTIWDELTRLDRKSPVYGMVLDYMTVDAVCKALRSKYPSYKMADHLKALKKESMAHNSDAVLEWLELM